MYRRSNGLWIAMLTPLREDGTPCLETVARLIELYVQLGLGGDYLAGSTGQWPLLSPEARRAIVEVAVKTAAGRLPVMVNVGAPATGEAVALAHHAAEMGAEVVAAVGPSYDGYSTEGVFEHYRRIGGATRLPFYVYHLMGVS